MDKYKDFKEIWDINKLLFEERNRYMWDKLEALEEPAGDIRELKIYYYNKILDILNNALIDKRPPDYREIERLKMNLREDIDRTMEWFNK